MNRRAVAISAGGFRGNLSAMVREAGPRLLLLLHGLGCSAETFHGIAGRKAFEDFTLIAPDLPGFGHSERPEEFSYEMEAHGAVCAALIAGFPFGELHIVAHSMGGAVGLCLPRNLLASARSFVNVEGNLTADDCGLLSRRSAAAPFPEFSKEILPGLREEYRDRPRGHLELDLADPLAFHRSAASLVAWSDSGRLLARFLSLPCPKLYLYGEKNADLPTLGRLTGVSKFSVASSGHFPMIDKPDLFYRRLAEFHGV